MAFDLAGLLVFRFGLYDTDEFFFVLFRKLNDFPQRFLNQCHHRISVYPVSAGAFAANRDFSIARAGKVCDTFSISSTIDIHRASAVCAVQQSAEGMGFAPAIRIAADASANPLHVVVSLLIDNRLLGVFDNRPLVLVNIMTFLVLKMLPGLEIAGVPQIAGIGQDVDDCGTTPFVGVSDFPRLP